jgi:hypothetical protein
MHKQIGYNVVHQDGSLTEKCNDFRSPEFLLIIKRRGCGDE